MQDDHEATQLIADVIDCWAQGRVTDEIYQATMMAIMHALPKGVDKIRPVAVGTQIRKLAMKAITIQCKEEIEQAAGDRQFGLGKRRR